MILHSQNVWLNLGNINISLHYEFVSVKYNVSITTFPFLSFQLPLHGYLISCCAGPLLWILIDISPKHSWARSHYFHWSWCFFMKLGHVIVNYHETSFCRHVGVQTLSDHLDKMTAWGLKIFNPLIISFLMSLDYQQK